MPNRSTAASAQVARASKTSGRSRSSWVAPTMRSARVRLHDADFAATKWCQNAVATPATARRRARVAVTRLPAAPRQTRPSSANAPIATKISRCSTHHGHGCIPNACCETRAARTAPNEATATRRTTPRSKRRREAPAASAPPSFGGLGDQFDLDAGAERQLGDAVGAARVRALLGEDLAEELGAAVGHQVVLGEVGRAVDEARDAHDALDLVEVADRGVERAEQVDRDRARRLLAGRRVHVAAELANPGLAVALGDVAGEEDKISRANEGHV